MNMLPATLATLRRPRLLVQAARFGLGDYRRDRDLTRLMGGRIPASTSATVAWLIDQEERLDEVRRAGDAGYSFARHIEILIALMAEAQLLCEIQSRNDLG